MNESTLIKIDLSKELTEDELKSFKQQAKKAGATSLKEHFMNINLKATSKPAA